MNPNKLNPGDEGHSAEHHLHCWHNNMANDLHNNDALWFWATKAGHEFVEWRGRGVMDLVLHHIFAMGLFDWSALNDCLNQTTLAMRHVTVMGMKLFWQIHENDLKVLLLSIFFGMIEIDEDFSMISSKRIYARQARKAMLSSTRLMRTWPRWIIGLIITAGTLTTRRRLFVHCMSDRNNSRRKWRV